jgi:hypothetical protein
MERRGYGCQDSLKTGSRAVGEAVAAIGGEAKKGQAVGHSAAMEAAGSGLAGAGLEDPQFWAQVVSGLRKMAQLGAIAASVEKAATLSWPNYSGDPLEFPAFKTKWKAVEKGRGVQLEDYMLCELFKKHVPPAMAAHMACFTSMKQVWDYMSVAVEEPLKVLEKCGEAVKKYVRVKDGDGEGLERRYRELEYFGAQAKRKGAQELLATAELLESVLKMGPEKERAAWDRFVKAVALVERPKQFFQFISERLEDWGNGPGKLPGKGEAQVRAARRQWRRRRRLRRLVSPAESRSAMEHGICH